MPVLVLEISIQKYHPSINSGDLQIKKSHPNELTPKSWTLCPTKGVLFYEQVQQAVQIKGS
jgi:hypothetical protein